MIRLPNRAAHLEPSAKTELDFTIVRDTVIRMETVTISPKFQIVIPQRIREAMGLRSGEKARMLSFRNRIEVIPVRDIRTLRGYLKGIDTSFIRDGDRV
jgi:AbrB family looped-hinge helix DNA binding protein